ncbi:MAG: DUF2797 domain-containing protein [Gammaproteobacteria bacterium]|nr:DUF2797 domain-containing protein [Gammaproteobacteria bacterium]
MTYTYHGNIAKMKTELNDSVEYRLPVGNDMVEMNALLGKQLHMRYQGAINCIHCGRKTKKSFSQGFCYPCFTSLAQCDMCIMKPETCHYAAGTCREPEWAEQHCMQDHYVYLANSSGLKVGITRGTQIPTRWMDQGATQAMPIFRTRDRLQAGLVEVIIKAHANDRTDWRKMLKGEAEPMDLGAERDRLHGEITSELAQLRAEHGDDAATFLPNEQQIEIRYPVLEYPTKVSSFNFDKTPEVGGTLMGIKGQYLILDGGVINMRKFAGYEIALEV